MGVYIILLLVVNASINSSGLSRWIPGMPVTLKRLFRSNYRNRVAPESSNGQSSSGVGSTAGAPEVGLAGTGATIPNTAASSGVAGAVGDASGNAGEVGAAAPGPSGTCGGSSARGDNN